ncbi:MAG: GTP 3',8-cyclase MoaA [Agriterribacter sp.]
MITDSFNRTHNYLRISLTDNCNLRCFYCMPDEEYHFTPASRLMQPHEIIALAKIFVQLGVTKIRLTGGEPLVRKDAAEIIQTLSALPVELTLTTNGTRIQEHLDTLIKANIRSLNISLDTLNADKFLFLTRRNQFHTVLNNINSLVEKGFNVKVNVVLMKGFNDDEIIDFIEWTRESPVQIRFIEFMPFTGNRWTSNKVFSWQELMHIVAERYTIIPQQPGTHDTAKAYSIPGHSGSFAVISTMTAPFCEGCNRIRLTADGKMKNCLFSKNETDLLTALRNGEKIEPLIRENIVAKERSLGGQFGNDLQHVHANEIRNRSMITIGG